MDKKTRIAEEVEKTLQCFEDFENIEPNPFFFTRLKARIRSFEGRKGARLSPGMEYQRTPSGIIKSAGSDKYFFGNPCVSGRDTQIETDPRKQYIAAFADEYSLNQEDTDLYSFAN